MYPLSSPNCPHSFSLRRPPPTLAPSDFLHQYFSLNSDKLFSSFFPFGLMFPSNLLTIVSRRKVFLIRSRTLNDNRGVFFFIYSENLQLASLLLSASQKDNKNRTMLPVITSCTACGTLSKSWKRNVFVQFSPGWRTPPWPRHQMEALLVFWAGPVISCQRSGVNQGLSQQKRPQLPYLHHLLFFMACLFSPFPSVWRQRNTFFLSPLCLPFSLCSFVLCAAPQLCLANDRSRCRRL